MTLLVNAVSTYALQAHAQPELGDDTLQLRAWSLSDAPAVLTAFQDTAIQQWHRVRLDGLDEAIEWAAAAARRWSAARSASWAVVKDGAVVGQAGLRNINTFEGQAELSYWTLPSARGSGVATGAVALVTRWAFGTAGLHRLIVNHSTRNETSCRVAQRAGFRPEGTKRQQLQHSDGWHDMHLHARLRSD